MPEILPVLGGSSCAGFDGSITLWGMKKTRFPALVGCLIFLTAATTQAADNVVLQWDNVALQAVRETKFGPPLTARALAILHTCTYDAWAAYDPKAVGTELGATLRRPAAEQTEANKNVAISFAAYRALVDLFPSKQALFASLMSQLSLDPANTSTDPSTPAGVGNAACAAVLAKRHADGSNQLGDLHTGAYTDYTSYLPVNTSQQINDPNRWQPLAVPDAAGVLKTQSFLAPHWGRVQPFALLAGAELRPAPPVLFFAQPKDAQERASNRRFVSQAKSVLDTSARLTDREKVIAEYWADGPASETPPGHWCLLAQFVSRRDGHTVDEDVKMYFALTNALLDASIAAWDAKRAYDSIRPISAIRLLFRGQQVRAWGGPGRGTQTILGENWIPYQAATFVTPPFPAYTSGHSTFSAAAATVLASFTRSAYFGASVTVPAGTSVFEPGLVPAKPVTLKWRTFNDASLQAGKSRIFGGIHFERDNVVGRQMGTVIGRRAWGKAKVLFGDGR